MTDIRIETLHLGDFKGQHDLTLDFHGRNATIIGDNGTGKSTIYDAFIWLLFGKDSRNQNQTKFDIKTIDPKTGEPIHHADHFVEAVLLVDGSKQTLKRVWREVWTKPKGEAVAVFTGHESAFFVNGVNVGTKAAYDTVIRSWIDENVFTMITNPLYFIDDTYTDWKSRREVLLSLAGDEIDKSEINARFAALLATMNGEPLAAFKKRIAAEKRENKKELARCEPALAAYQKMMPEAEDYAAIEKEITTRHHAVNVQIAALRTEIESIDAQIADVHKADEATRREHDAKIAEISRIKNEMQSYLDAATSTAKRANIAREDAITAARRAAEKIDDEIARTKRDAVSKWETIETSKAKRESLKKEVDAMRDEYAEAKSSAFEYAASTLCHACGRELPADTVADAQRIARERFETERRAALDKMVSDAQLRKDTYSKLATLIDNYERELALTDQRISGLVEECATAQEQYNAINASKPIDLSTVEAQAKENPDYKRRAIRITEMQTELDLFSGVDASELTSKRAEVEQQITAANERLNAGIQDLKSRLDTRKQRDDAERFISEEQAKERTLSTAIAELERLEFDAAAYTKADIEAVEKPINSHFKLARWRMYDRTIDGEEESCKVTHNSVPYESMNSAMRTLVGIDVIRAFCEFYGVRAPVFVDNAESITDDAFDVTSQVIRLVVAKGEKLSLLTA